MVSAGLQPGPMGSTGPQLHLRPGPTLRQGVWPSVHLCHLDIDCGLLQGPGGGTSLVRQLPFSCSQFSREERGCESLAIIHSSWGMRPVLVKGIWAGHPWHRLHRAGYNLVANGEGDRACE